MLGLSQIQTFLEVAKSGSFAGASRRLSVPRSTVSARVRALEERLNVRLLHRTTRRLALTDEGGRYMAHCQGAIDRLMQAEAELSRLDEISGTVRLTVPVDLSKRWLAETLSAFADQHPRLRIEVLVTDAILDLVARNIDLALRGGAPGAPGLVARKLGDGRLALYASPRYAAATLRGQTLSSLSGQVVLDPAHQCRGSIADGARSGQIETRNFELAKALAIQSRGMALLPEDLCKEEIQDGRLIRIAFDQPLPVLPLYIVMPTRLHIPARVRALVDSLTVAETQPCVTRDASGSPASRT